MAEHEHLASVPAAHRTPWAWLVGTFLGVGLLRPGPGTYGSIAALLLWFGAAHTFHPSPLQLIFGTVIAAFAATLVGIPAATIVARETGRKDPGHIVIDEVAGQLVALIAIPADWHHAALSLLLFRVVDILKPPPVRQLECLPEGTGIVLDDIAAGLLALAIAHIAKLFF